MRRRVRFLWVSGLLLISCLSGGMAEQLKSESAIRDDPILEPGTRYRQHPKFPQVKTDSTHGFPVAVPKDSQPEFAALMEKARKADLSTRQAIYDQVCARFGNYRYPMYENEAGALATRNMLFIIWEDCYCQLAGLYRERDMKAKAIPLEQDVLKWGSSGIVGPMMLTRLQQGLEIKGTLLIPPGAHKPDAAVYAGVTLDNANETTVRTTLMLRTVKEFDSYYRPKEGRWVPIAHKGSRLVSSPEYDVFIAPKAVLRGRIRVSAHALEHVGSYDLELNCRGIQCKSNVATLRYEVPAKAPPK